jgi:hypothetical protein
MEALRPLLELWRFAGDRAEITSICSEQNQYKCFHAVLILEDSLLIKRRSRIWGSVSIRGDDEHWRLVKCLDKRKLIQAMHYVIKEWSPDAETATNGIILILSTDPTRQMVLTSVEGGSSFKGKEKLLFMITHCPWWWNNHETQGH